MQQHEREHERELKLKLLPLLEVINESYRRCSQRDNCTEKLL